VHVDINGRLDASEASAKEVALFGAEDMKAREFKEITVIEYS